MGTVLASLLPPVPRRAAARSSLPDDTGHPGAGAFVLPVYRRSRRSRPVYPAPPSSEVCCSAIVRSA
eukprot:9030930-Pyramimonas_sp.AAC.1